MVGVAHHKVKMITNADAVCPSPETIAKSEIRVIRTLVVTMENASEMRGRRVASTASAAMTTQAENSVKSLTGMLRLPITKMV
jgi:hypothetical protein